MVVGGVIVVDGEVVVVFDVEWMSVGDRNALLLTDADDVKVEEAGVESGEDVVVDDEDTEEDDEDDDEGECEGKAGGGMLSDEDVTGEGIPDCD